MGTIERLNDLCGQLATGEADDQLAAKSSDESGMRWEVYARGYPLVISCRTAREAEQCIRRHYRELQQQLTSGTATPIHMMR